jgi:hypothetical protein
MIRLSRKYPDASVDQIERLIGRCHEAREAMPRKHEYGAMWCSLRDAFREIGACLDAITSWETAICELHLEWATARLEEVAREAAHFHEELRANFTDLENTIGPRSKTRHELLKFLRSLWPEPVPAAKRVGGLPEERVRATLAAILEHAELNPRKDQFGVRAEQELMQAGLLIPKESP